MFQINAYIASENTKEYEYWASLIPEKQPIVAEDLAIGWGITIPKENATYERINEIIQEHGNEHIWVQEEGFLQCVHYTKATYSDLYPKGLYGNINNSYTFAHGIYVYNKNQHVINPNESYVEFSYYGPYYKCVYDPDPWDELSKDIGTSQEYLIPTMHISYRYLDIAGLKEQ
jgi:hypothetical protein